MFRRIFAARPVPIANQLDIFFFEFLFDSPESLEISWRVVVVEILLECGQFWQHVKITRYLACERRRVLCDVIPHLVGPRAAVRIFCVGARESWRVAAYSVR